MEGFEALELDAGDGPALAAMRRAAGGHRVIALHGWLDNAASFGPLASRLTDLDLVCLEFPGHGDSPPRPPSARYHFDDYVFDVLAAARALEWESFHLLGHSLGGAVASVLAAACPERVTTLNVIEGLGPLTLAPDRTAEGWRRAVEASRERPRRIHATREAAVEARCRNSDLDRGTAATLATRGLVRDESEAGPGWRWRHDLRLTWPSTQRYTEPQVLDLLGAIECPACCVLAAPRTRVVPPGLMERRAAAVRRLTLHELPGGHHLHMERPDEVAPLIEEHIHAHA
ncbi:MAG: alpha/beta hydrolase [Wenzhouxiangellaceae bacterium]|nr:alpha/beta hydrolase [Wenzhouxiangellaceae bacterium]